MSILSDWSESSTSLLDLSNCKSVWIAAVLSDLLWVRKKQIQRKSTWQILNSKRILSYFYLLVNNFYGITKISGALFNNPRGHKKAFKQFRNYGSCLLRHKLKFLLKVARPGKMIQPNTFNFSNEPFSSFFI